MKKGVKKEATCYHYHSETDGYMHFHPKLQTKTHKKLQLKCIFNTGLFFFFQSLKNANMHLNMYCKPPNQQCCVFPRVSSGSPLFLKKTSQETHSGKCWIPNSFWALDKLLVKFFLPTSLSGSCYGLNSKPDNEWLSLQYQTTQVPLF